MPQISIIVPVYKVEKYLSRCIDSILSQSFADFELLLIDDGSPDDCGRICDDYSEKDGRIIVFHKENGGVSSARNVGIEKARGDYLVFIDSDDYIAEDYLSLIMAHDEDLVCQTANIMSEDGSIINTPLRNEITISGIEFDSGFYSQLLLNGAFNWIHCKRFCSSIIRKNGISFDTTLDFAEDTLFVVEYSRYINSICVENIANYRYVVYKTRKTLSNDYSKERFAVLKNANDRICSLISTNETEKESLYNKRMAGPYAAMIAHEEKKHFFLFRVNCYLSLHNDNDFLKVLSTEKKSFSMPEKMCTAILQKRKAKTVFEYYRWIFYRIARKIYHCMIKR